MRIASIIGTRPNLIKLNPIYHAINDIADHHIIHTGQHYDYQLSEIFFKEFDLPKADVNLGVGSGSPGFQAGEMIKKLEIYFLKKKFDLVIVYGDTSSTFAGAFSASRAGISVAHLESGLRVFDRWMIEETNRILTDHLSDYLFTPTRTALRNLKQENVRGEIVPTGDVSVEIIKNTLKESSKSSILEDLQLEHKSYILLTLHRAENTSSKERLISVIRALEKIPWIKTVFPIHPRTKKMLKETNLYDRLKKNKNIKILPPVGFIDFIKLMRSSQKIITDSGGIQKEAYLLRIPCITIRKNTEWIETVDSGWNILVDADVNRIVKGIKNWTPTERIKPIFGNGNTSKIIKNFISSL